MEICPLTNQQINLLMPNPGTMEFFYETPKTGKVKFTDVALAEASGLSDEEKQILTGICRNRTIKEEPPLSITSAFLKQLKTQNIPRTFQDKSKHFLQFLYNNGGKEYKSHEINSDLDSPITYSSVDEFERIIKYLKDEKCIVTDKETLTQQFALYQGLYITKTGIEEIEKDITKLPIIELSNDEELWLTEAYNILFFDHRPNQREIFSNLHNKVSSNFSPKGISHLLIDSSGEVITLLGAIALQRNYSIVEKANKIIYKIKEHLLLHTKEANISIIDIANQCNIPSIEAGIIFYLVSFYGSFYQSCSSSTNGFAIHSINIGTDNRFFRQYYFFDGLEKLILSHIKDAKPIKNNFDWNWFFNADNIPNQDAVFATKEFLEERRSQEFEALDFFNILFKQIDELKKHLDKPYDYIKGLHSLPFNDLQKHTLFGMILYWHGGYPVNNLNPKYNTILKLIERDFLSMFPNELTPEMEFCATSVEKTRLLNEVGAHVHAALRSELNIPESKYLKNIIIDFEDLPQYIIQRGIIWKFENQINRKDSDYTEWQDKMFSFLKTIPGTYVIKTLQKGIEYAKKVYQYHLDNECSHPSNCDLNQSWERRIAISEQILESIMPKEVNEEPEGNGVVKNKDFTTARQVLVVHYLLKQQGINPVDTPTAVAKLVQFITGRELNTNRIQDTTIYKKVIQPFSLNEKTLKKDLEYIMSYFKELGLTTIVDEIEKEIKNCS